MDDTTPPAQTPALDEPADAPSAGDSGEPAGRPHRFTRRQALTMAGAGAGVLAGAGLLGNWLSDDGPSTGAEGDHERHLTTTSTSPSTTTSSEPAPGPAIARWSDPGTWGGRVPGSRDVVTVDRPVLLDVDANVAGVRIEAPGELVFDATQSRTLTSTGNVVVGGTLRMHPGATIRFRDVNEDAFVGGSPDPFVHGSVVDSDVGLWVVDSGVLDALGTPKKAWTRAVGALSAGATTIQVHDATGWLVGDEIVVTPTEPATVSRHEYGFDRRRINAISGNTITLNQPLSRAHPAVTVRSDVTFTAEVLNLTRDVKIEGSPAGKAHVIFLGLDRPQTIRHVELSHLGVGKVTADEGDWKWIETLIGRYAFHFHHGREHTTGTLVEGVVAHDIGNHCFVPHFSNGITFRDCVAHETHHTPFWWDPAAGSADEVPTYNLTLENCVASKVWTAVDTVRPTTPREFGTETAGFWMGAGAGNVARGCVAVGVLNGRDSQPGFVWPERSRNEHDTWICEDCLAHNNSGSAIYYWQNVVPRTVVDRFTAYYNRFGILAGAYANLASYRDCTLYANKERGLEITAVPDGGIPTYPGETVTYEGLYVDQAGLTDHAVDISSHLAEPALATEVRGCHFQGGRVAQIGWQANENPQLYNITDCTFHGNVFWLPDGLAEANDIRVRDPLNGSIRLRRKDQEGTLRPEWNARVSEA